MFVDGFSPLRRRDLPREALSRCPEHEPKMRQSLGPTCLEQTPLCEFEVASERAGTRADDMTDDLLVCSQRAHNARQVLH